MARNQRAAALKAWATRRARAGGHASGMGPVAVGSAELRRARVGSRIGSGGHASGMGPAALGLPAWKDRPVRPAGVREAKGYDADARARLATLKAGLTKGQRAYGRRKAREQAMRDAGLVKVRGARGGIYWE